MLYKVIDNFLPSVSAIKLRDFLLGADFPYYYQYSVSYFNPQDHYYYFNHQLYRNGACESWYYSQIIPGFLEPLAVKELLRAKVNAYPRESANVLHSLHTDLREPHSAAIWSANDCDGGTRLIIDGESIDIQSRHNRMIVFDGSVEHAPISQTDQKLRVNINFNFVGAALG